MSAVSMFAFIMFFMHCSKVCFVMLADCVPNLFCFIFLTVTPFGVFFICNLISFSCTLCLCYCLLLLTNLKYGLGQNSTKCFNCRGALSVCHVWGVPSLTMTSIGSLLYAPPFSCLCDLQCLLE